MVSPQHLIWSLAAEGHLHMLRSQLCDTPLGERSGTICRRLLRFDERGQLLSQHTGIWCQTMMLRPKCVGDL